MWWLRCPQRATPPVITADYECELLALYCYNWISLQYLRVSIGCDLLELMCLGIQCQHSMRLLLQTIHMQRLQTDKRTEGHCHRLKPPSNYRGSGCPRYRILELMSCVPTANDYQPLKITDHGLPWINAFGPLMHS